jgi:hypothetical protein
MRTFCIAAIVAGLAVTAVAQTSAGGSASGSASVSPGQASAGASASQNAQTPAASTPAASTPAASTNVNGGANGNVSQSNQKNGPDKGSAATGSNSAAGVNGASGALSNGTTLQAELTKSIDAKKAKQGDEVTAKLTQDVKSSGQVVLHKGTKLVGHVTEVQAKSKESGESRLGIAFDKAVLKGGEEMAFTGVIQALAPPVQGSLSATTDTAGNMGSGMGSGSGAGMGGGRTSSGGASGAPMGGGAVNSTVGTATNTVNNTAGSISNTANGAVNGSLNQATGIAANGAINSATRGVVGMQGVALSTATAGSAQGSIISSAGRNVKLDSGTQMILQVTGSAASR